MTADDEDPFAELGRIMERPLHSIIAEPVSLDDLTPELRRSLIKFDDRFGPRPGPLDAMHETNLRVLARFGLADEAERCLTDRGRRLVDEGEVG